MFFPWQHQPPFVPCLAVCSAMEVCISSCGAPTEMVCAAKINEIHWRRVSCWPCCTAEHHGDKLHTQCWTWVWTPDNCFTLWNKWWLFLSPPLLLEKSRFWVVNEEQRVHYGHVNYGLLTLLSFTAGQVAKARMSSLSCSAIPRLLFVPRLLLQFFRKWEA